ncbi:AFL075Wp [Eremothecium gossypii ATCC 10895]|uniref:DNA damage checkpoint protein 1 n=1 Tax=Eremothecium gossypii (strain ATCC 10895 / CBS 109.51 / FGSC 9923 / NRRL Y-1056) TaxID=284811 RepID=DDC1_EREGS|nr:AFL075Wp [Eremothecium gossypii ATCC 10895]Q755A0.1 RecName: Full=DNA damage checkpoint protein 1 [Eremothecium gossypii ATCC 10895]AAS53297.1 AFL075Wp [Eremothecium gossypii ATCC 10895]AEY97607.1 FAFL075Wp [Eremothecium gossypii FDAG1]
MSFRAVITSSEHQAVWSRLILTLSTINQDIKFTIMSNELILWSMNSTDTTMYQVRLKASFFSEFSFDPGNIVFGEEGLQVIEDLQKQQHTLYSFVINGRHLSILSRKPEYDNIKEFSLSIDNSTAAPEAIINRLHIRVYTESLITKEFSPAFNPVKYDPIVIDLKYKKKFLDVYGTEESVNGEQADPRLLDFFRQVRKQLEEAKFNEGIIDAPRPAELRSEHEINFLSMDSLIWRNAIDLCTNNTEELKLDLTMNKMVITAFTKGVQNMKSSDVLKQAISISNSVSTEDVEHYCLFTTSGNPGMSKKDADSKQAVFKLRDFRNFFSANQAWKENATVNCWFCSPGDPILFEIDRGHVKLSLVQITDTAGKAVGAAPDLAIHPVLVSPRKPVSPLRAACTNTNAASNALHGVQLDAANMDAIKTLFVQDVEIGVSAAAMAHSPANRCTDENLRSMCSISQQGQHSCDGSPATNLRRVSRAGTTIAWGAGKDHVMCPDSDYGVAQDVNQLKRRKVGELAHASQSPESQDYGLGPTQQYQPKGIFD